MRLVCHTCKYRFCPSCGKKTTDNWINRHLQILPKTTWQHVTFTFPQDLQPLFWLNRHLFNQLMPIPAKIITNCAAKMGVIPGIFVAMHTLGRDLKRNLHFHLSTTISGLSLDKSKWWQNSDLEETSYVRLKNYGHNRLSTYYEMNTIKATWYYQIIWLQKYFYHTLMNTIISHHGLFIFQRLLIITIEISSI